MDKIIRTFDWSKTPLGPIETWPQSLKTAVDIMLGADLAISIYWGADNILLYNDAWRDLFGVQHPQALGRPAREVLPQVWEIIGPILARLLSDGKTAQAPNQPLLLPRNGRSEEAWVTFDFSPLPCEDGSIGGIFNVSAETTEQVRNAQTQREQEPQFRDLAELCPDAILVNVQGRFAYANPAAARLLAAETPQDLVGRSPFEFLDLEYHDLVESRLKQILFEGRSVPELEYRWRRLDGSHVDVKVFAGPINWGEVPAVQVVLRDITERKRREALQKENEERKSFLLHLSDTLRPLTDSSQIQAVASRALAEHLNAARCYYGEIDESAGHCVIHRDYVRDGVSSIAGTHRISEPSFLPDVLRTGRPLVIPDTASADLSEKDQSQLESIALKACIAIPLVKQNRLMGVFAVNETRPRAWSSAEVSLVEEAAERIWAAIERALAAEALRQSEERFRALVMASSEVLYRMSPDWSEMHQLYSRQFLTNSVKPNRAWLQEYIHPEDQEEVTAAIDEAIQTKSIFELEHRVRQADGSWGWTISRAVPLLDATGQIVEWFGAASDISGRKQAEEALKDAKAAAEDANQAKSEFLAKMSHEIRTPMTIFMGSIQHLMHKDRNPEDKKLLEMADQSAERLRVLIEDILDFSRIEARAVTLEEKAFDLRSCVHQTVAMFILPAEEKKLRLETSVAPEVPEVVIGDCNKLSQVLINLIGNAVKYTPAGSVQVSVTARDGLLEFMVTDTGIGVPADKHGLLFKSFSQIHSSSDHHPKGTGLGLAISRELVALMGGDISVSSRAEGGSIFTFTLPLKASEEQQSD